MADTQLGGARRGDEQLPESVEQSTPSGRRPGLWTVAGVVLALALIAWLVQARGAGDRTTYLTEEARIADLEDRVEAAATVAWPRDATADLLALEGGTVTAVDVQAGDRPTSLQTLFEVDAAPLVALVSRLPLYRDLEEGDEGHQVEVLEQALIAADYDPGPDDGVFGEQTAEALTDFQEDNGIEETGRLLRARTLWVPPGGQVTAVDVRPGDSVSPGTPLASVAVPDRLVVNAEIDQADVARVEQGAPAAVTLDALDAQLNGTVERVALMPGEEGTYTATVQLDDPPDALRAGMEGTARIVAERREDVVVVPSGAVSGSDDAATVRVLAGDEPEVRDVELGLVTTDGAEIVSGVASGDAVVVGERE